MSIDVNIVTLNKSKDNQELLIKDKCDKYDYLIATVCGAVGGVIDILLVGAPGESVLGKWTDQQVDNVVMSFAKKMGWNPKQNNTQNVKSAIGFLERKYKVNYDQRKPSDVGNVFNIAPKTHHMMSLAHSPDIVGLFFSIINQFTSTSTFIADGQIITINSETYELQGGNFIAKLFCGFTNWIKHLMSDVAGGSGAHDRGTGIVMPFYELFGLFKFGSFKTNDGVKDFAEIATSAFAQGYDFRFGLAQAIPVVLCELSIRLIWALRRRFQFGYSIKECIPTKKHDSLRVMLLVGEGTLCVMDAIDAGIRSGGNFLAFFMRLNIVAWFRFVTSVIKEVCIRVGLSSALQKDLEAFKRVNEALEVYYAELKTLDIEKYKEETNKYINSIHKLSMIDDEESLNKYLIDIYNELCIPIPWKGDFNEFMSDKNNTLEFE